LAKQKSRTASLCSSRKIKEQIALIAAQTVITPFKKVIIKKVYSCKKVSEHLLFLLLG